MQLRESLAHGAARLASGPHPDRARRDAETLLLHLTGKNRAWLMTHGTDEFGGCTAIQYAGLLDRRLAGEPIQYILGETEFFGLPFRVTRDVLIPRPETEHLVEAAIMFANRHNLLRIVDVGTGSGAIAIAIARALPDAAVTAIDLFPEALAVARQNAESNNTKIRLLRGDLLEPVAGEPVSLVVSNPPYVSEADRPTLSVEVRDFEPSLALFAGNDGLDIYRRLIPQAFNVLSWGGHILLEIGYGQAQPVSALLEQSGFFDVQYLPDLQGIPRVLHAIRLRD